MPYTTLGIVGGSGLYRLPGLQDVRTLSVETPYGSPSADLTLGRLGASRLVFLPRHGLDHRIPPHQINYRANVCALAQAGAELVVSVSAVGSLRPDVIPGDALVVDQYIDWTRSRKTTFFEDGVVGHAAMADPACPVLCEAVAQSLELEGERVHRGGTYVCIDGPQFSTRAESHLYRSFGASVIGMTAMPEAKLAREAGLPYCTLAMCTDFDCWRPEEQAVSVAQVLETMAKNTELGQRVLHRLAETLPNLGRSPTPPPQASMMSDPAMAPPEARERLAWLFTTLDRRPRC